MLIFDKPDCLLPEQERGVGLGFFDGVHRGHLELLRILIYNSRELALPAAVFTFPAHPESVLNPEDLFTSYLGDLAARMEQLALTGIDEVHLQPFDQAFAAIEPEDFLDRIIAGRLRARLIVVGPDYRFGRRGRGDIHLLQRWAEKSGITCVVVPQVSMGGEKISSSRIRALIGEGNLALAASLLGRPYRLSGQVVTGRGLGHNIGFPTANIPVPSYLACPAYGVYATRTRHAGRSYESVTNIGLRPTVDTGNVQPVIETNLLDVDLTLYGQEISVDFLDMLRPEERFDSIEALRRQIEQDRVAVRQWHHGQEQGYELLRCGGIPLHVLPSRRFAQASLQVVFHTPLSSFRSACQTLLMRVLTASCRRFPSRVSLSLAQDDLYGAEIDADLESMGDLQQITLSAEALARWSDGSSPFREACSLLFDLLFDPLTDAQGLFDAAFVEAERQALLLEMASRENDRAKYAYDRTMEIFCGGKAQGLPPAGSREDVSRVSRDDLRQTYQELLHDCRVELYLGGLIDPETADAVQAGIRRFPDAERPALFPGRAPAPFKPAPESRVTEHKRVEQARIAMVYTGLPPYFSQRSMQTAVLNSMLGGGVHSLLFDVVREKMGLAYSVFSMNLRCLGALLVMAGVAPDQVEPALDAARRQVEDLAAGRFPPSLLARSCQMIESRLLAAGDELPALLTRQISGRLLGRDIPVRESVRQLGDITPQDISSLASELRLVTTYVLDQEVP